MHDDDCRLLIFQGAASGAATSVPVPDEVCLRP